MNSAPAILTNMTFHQSRVWSEAAVTICRRDETPDNLCPLRQAMRLLLRRRSFNVVVTMGARPSLAYGLLCAALHLPSRQIMTEVFLDAAHPFSPGWRFKTALFRRISRRALGILTNSSGEVEFMARRFKIPAAKAHFVPMYTTIAAPGRHDETDGTVVSIGRTLRDLETLVAAARDIPAPVVVVTGACDRLPPDLPANVQVLREISQAESHALLARAAVVALPLLPAERSTGQVVLFEALAMGKPVVATRATGTVDYVRDGENGLLVEPGDAAGLACAVNRLLTDTRLVRRLAETAVADCRSEWNIETHAARKIAAIRALVAQSAGRA